MTTNADKYRWARLRRSLRNFTERCGWTPGQIAKAVNDFYGHPATEDDVEQLLSDARIDPRSAHGLDAFANFMGDHAACRLPFDQWFARRSARAPRPIWTQGDALIARAVAVETERANHRRFWLGRERRAPGRGVIPNVDPLAGFDGATIAALSGGTIILRGVRA